MFDEDDEKSSVLKEYCLACARQIPNCFSGGDWVNKKRDEKSSLNKLTKHKLQL